MKIFSFIKYKHLLFLSILLIVCYGGFFRFYNLNWDHGDFFHPDERNIASAVAKIHFFNQLNPEFFAYGGLTIYLYRFAGDILVAITHNPSWVSDWGHINLISRFFSAFFSTLTIIAIYKLATELWNKTVAIIATFFAAFCVTFIQTAHYGITENIVTLFAVLLCLFCLKLLKHPRLSIYLICGGLVGFSAAAKTTALSLGIFFVVTQLIISIIHRKKISTHTVFFFISLVSGSFLFTLFSPYTFLSFQKFLESMQYESGVATGSLPVVYTYQFNGTIPYLFQYINFFWQIGLSALLIIPAIGFLLFHALIKKRYTYFIFLSFPLIYFAYVGSWHTKFIRYMVPIIPFLILAISFLLYTIIKKIKISGIIITAFFILATIVWGIAFFSIYTREQTRIVASEFIYQAIPSQSKILTEHWDDGLPVGIGEKNPSIYTIDQLTIYEPDNQQKVEYYAQKLSQSDYLIINSRRLYGTLIHLTHQYPITSKYYRLLFNQALGYQKIGEFTSYPSLLGLKINDDSSEETFQVYEHPKVMVFKNSAHLNAETMRLLLQ